MLHIVKCLLGHVDIIISVREWVRDFPATFPSIGIQSSTTSRVR